MKKDSVLDILFFEKLLTFSLAPFMISASFFCIVIESAKLISGYSSPFFDWYIVYILIIVPLSIYTNSATNVGSRFIRSTVESVVEFFLLLLLNFVLLKGFSFGKNIGEFIDFDFGLSFLLWISLRVLNGHLVRTTNFPYEIFTNLANAVSSSTPIEEVFDENFFKDRSVKNSLRSIVISIIFMLFFIGILFALSRPHWITIFYSIFFISFSIFLILNISKFYLIEDSLKKGIQLSSANVFKEITNFSVIYVSIILVFSLIVALGIYYPSKFISERVNLGVKQKINEILQKESQVNEEEIQKIREKLLSEEKPTNAYVYNPKPKTNPSKGVSFFLVMFVISLVLSVIILVGFVLKEILKIKKLPVLGFFISFYELFVYIVVKIVNWIIWIFKSLFIVRRPVINKDLEEELMRTMVLNKEQVSKEKMEEIETIVKIFLDMLNITSYILPYKRSMGIEEYCETLKNYIPEFSSHLDFISEVVNESRFSNHLIPYERIDELKVKVNDIITKIKPKVVLIEGYRGG
ncbi:MAG: hypothetical protein ACPL4C_02920 [Brevinematia bacterium]